MTNTTWLRTFSFCSLASRASTSMSVWRTLRCKTCTIQIVAPEYTVTVVFTRSRFSCLRQCCSKMQLAPSVTVQRIVALCPTTVLTGKNKSHWRLKMCNWSLLETLNIYKNWDAEIWIQNTWIHYIWASIHLRLGFSRIVLKPLLYFGHNLGKPDRAHQPEHKEHYLSEYECCSSSSNVLSIVLWLMKFCPPATKNCAFFMSVILILSTWKLHSLTTIFAFTTTCEAEQSLQLLRHLH